MNWTVMNPIQSTFAASLVALSMLGMSVAQQPFVPFTKSLQTSSGISAAAGGAADAASVVAVALTDFLTGSGRTQVTVDAAQMPEEWLPVMPSIHFVRLDTEALNAYHNACGTVLWISADRVERRLTITVGEHMKCRGGGRSYEFARESNGWRLEPNRLGGGFRSSTSHCDCP